MIVQDLLDEPEFGESVSIPSKASAYEEAQWERVFMGGGNGIDVFSERPFLGPYERLTLNHLAQYGPTPNQNWREGDYLTTNMTINPRSKLYDDLLTGMISPYELTRRVVDENTPTRKMRRGLMPEGANPLPPRSWYSIHTVQQTEDMFGQIKRFINWLVDNTEGL